MFNGDFQQLPTFSSHSPIGQAIVQDIMLLPPDSSLEERAHSRLFISLRFLWIFVYYMIGVFYYNHIEHWTVIECLYFITVSVATVGYGQYHPTTNGSRLFTCFYILLGLVTVLNFIDAFAKVFINGPLDYFITKYDHNRDRARHQRHKIIVTFCWLFCLMLMGTWFYSVNENWDSTEGFYFTIQTMTTVGWGDLHVKEDSTHIFTILFITICLTSYVAAAQNLRERFEEFKTTLSVGGGPGTSLQTSAALLSAVSGQHQQEEEEERLNRVIGDLPALRHDGDPNANVVTSSAFVLECLLVTATERNYNITRGRGDDAKISNADLLQRLRDFQQQFNAIATRRSPSHGDGDVNSATGIRGCITIAEMDYYCSTLRQEAAQHQQNQQNERHTNSGLQLNSPTASSSTQSLLTPSHSNSYSDNPMMVDGNV